MNEILAIIVSCSSLLIAGANLATFMIIKFNDMKHQDESLKRIEKSCSEIWVKVDNTAERLSYCEGKLASMEKDKD